MIMESIPIISVAVTLSKRILPLINLFSKFVLKSWIINYLLVENMFLVQFRPSSKFEEHALTLGILFLNLLSKVKKHLNK